MEAPKTKQEDVLSKIEEFREQRKAKEKARLEKLRMLNIQKYKTEGNTASVFQNSMLPTAQSRPKNFNSMTDLRRKSMVPKPSGSKSAPLKRNQTLDTNGEAKTLESHDDPKLRTNESQAKGDASEISVNGCSSKENGLSVAAHVPALNGSDPIDKSKVNKKVLAPKGGIGIPKIIQKPMAGKQEIAKKATQIMPAVTNQRKSMAAGPSKVDLKKYVPENSSNPGQSKTILKKAVPACEKINRNESNEKKDISSRKSLAPAKSDQKMPSSRISVFERLYQPKNQITKPPTNARKEAVPQKIRPITSFANSRRSLAPVVAAPANVAPLRRSYSTMFRTKSGKKELTNRQRSFSFGEGLDKVDLKKINEDEPIAVSHGASTARSERKKTVKFQNATPRADELERKLKSWLQKRGKSPNSFHHLRCFGVDRLAPSEKDIFNVEPYDDENKENIAVEDDGSYTDLLNDREKDFEEVKMKWRRASCFNDSEVLSEYTDAEDKSMASEEIPVNIVDELLLGALADLTQLVRDGYDWEQCARWLRAIRDRSPRATEAAAYWECRAALEECRGNLPRSCLCWEEAIAKGTETSAMEGSLDQLLDKFMRLNISPERGQRTINPQDMLCAKNVFKSSLIRFAVQNARAKSETAKFTVTPVRRSSRNAPGSRPTPRARGDRTPLLQLASSLKLIDEEIRDKTVFVPNKMLHYSP